MLRDEDRSTHDRHNVFEIPAKSFVIFTCFLRNLNNVGEYKLYSKEVDCKRLQLDYKLQIENIKRNSKILVLLLIRPKFKFSISFVRGSSP